MSYKKRPDFMKSCGHLKGEECACENLAIEMAGGLEEELNDIKNDVESVTDKYKDVLIEQQAKQIEALEEVKKFVKEIAIHDHDLSTICIDLICEEAERLHLIILEAK